MITIVNKKTSELSRNDLKGILDSFNEVFSTNRTYEEMMNQYTQNVLGYSFHNIIYDEQEIVGHTADVPSYYWIDGVKTLVVNGVDTFIKKEYRDGDIFLNQFASIYNNLKEKGVKMLIGFPDNKVLKLYLKTRLVKKIGEMDINILPYRIGAVKPSLSFLNFMSKSFSWLYVYINGIFSKNEIVEYKNVKDQLTYNATRYLRMDRRYYKVKIDNWELFYKIHTFKGVRAAFLIDLTIKTSKNFNRSIKYILKNNRKEFDVIIYVGNLYFPNSGLIKVPQKYAPKHFNFTVKCFDKQMENESLYNIRNWDVNLAAYDVI